MDWISKLERKYGKYAIDNIMKYIIILQIGGYIIISQSYEFYFTHLSLDAAAILRGEIWRVVTFLMDPPTYDLIFIIFAFYLYYMIGQSLERIWGVFRFNLYLISGVLFHVIGAILAYLITGVSYPLGTEYLYLSLFFAFVFSFPEVEFRLFFVLPIKAKYLGYINGAFFAYTILKGILPSYENVIYKANAIAALVSMLNFLLFYYSTRKMRGRSVKQVKQAKKFKKEIKKAQRPVATYAGGAKHRCTVCGRTELDDPTLEFRYCSKCKGNHEYCQDHLFTHQHIN